MEAFERERDGLRLRVEPHEGRRAVGVEFRDGSRHLLLRDEINLDRANQRERCANRLDDALQESARTLLTEAAEEVARLRETAEAAPRANATQNMLDLVDDAGVDFFLDEHGTPFATFAVAGQGVGRGMAHVETWPLRSRQLSGWCRTRHNAAHGKPIPSNALRDALSECEARAHTNGTERPVSIRVARAPDGVWLDLGDSGWTVVRVTPTGWDVHAWPATMGPPPVRFRRGRGTTVLDPPVHGGSLDALREFVPATDEDWPLILGWLVACLRPTGPYPVLVIQGEQGSAKSTVCRMLRSLVDPSSAPLRSLPRTERDLAIHAATNWVVCIDNVSSIPAWLADCICRLATGGGFSTRELYSDAEEVIFTAQRPVILNGIEELTNRDDLRDRALIVTLPSIPDRRRRDEASLWAAFEAARPFILGALLTAVSGGLSRADEVRLGALPRMADFARWAVACEPDLGLPEGAFMRAYHTNRQESIELSLTDSPVAQGVLRLLARHRGEWEGTASELLARLTNSDLLDSRPIVPVSDQNGGEWPRDARGLSGKLSRLAPALRRLDPPVHVGQRKSNGRKLWEIRELDPFAGSQTELRVASGPHEPEGGATLGNR